MNIVRNTITIHGDKEIYVLIPQEISQDITAGHDNKGFVMILGNGSGYLFLAKCFSIASELQKNEILYIPVRFKGGHEFEECFRNFDYNLNIILTNYCNTQISIKDIEKVLQIKVYRQELISRTPKIIKEYIESWKTDRRLTVKIHKRNLYITTNRDGFSSLACGAGNLSKYGDDVQYNDFPPHLHFDWEENTCSSVGVTLYYWNNY